MFVPNLKIITVRRKTGYRASKPIKRKGEKKKKEWKVDILGKRQKKNKEILWVPQKLINSKEGCDLSCPIR